MVTIKPNLSIGGRGQGKPRACCLSCPGVWRPDIHAFRDLGEAEVFGFFVAIVRTGQAARTPALSSGA
jgi:hypothetical protein